MQQMIGTYDGFLVFLSYAISVLASYTALDMGGRVKAAQGRIRLIWLSGGALAMGLGIWSMHFVGMLAYRMPMEVHYDVALVLLSMIFAVIASYIALGAVGGRHFGWRNWIVGGLFMAFGIVGMHYTGMTAMKMNAVIQYSPLYLVLSVVIALIASMVAMWLTFHFRDDIGRSRIYYKIGSGFVMGAAISGMHYTGMEAARFISLDHMHWMNNELSVETSLIAYVIVMMTLLLLGIALVTSFVDKRLAYHAAKLHESEQHFQSLFDYNTDAVFSIDLEGRFIAANPAVEAITGYSAEETVGRSLSGISELWNTDELGWRVAESIKGIPQKFEMTIKHKQGQAIDLSVTCVPIVVNREVTGLFGICQDITEKKQAERRINDLAYRDDLTGMPNRRYLLETLNVLTEAEEETEMALLVIDIDRFKLINDSIGQKQGDRLLRQLSDRLYHAAGEEKVIARIGSDEFAVLLCGIAGGESEAAVEALRLHERLQRPFTLGAHKVYLSLTIGYSVQPVSANGEMLLKHADSALFYSKKQGRNRVQAYSSEMDEASEQKLALENGLRLALERDEFEVHYQPQVNMQGRVIGAEALVRWRHPEQGLVSPGLFIPVAEESGLIHRIGECVLRMACQQNKLWQEAGFPPMPVSVNLSNKQFEQPHLIESIREALQESGLEPKYLDLEITESMMAADANNAETTLRRLKQIGVQVSMDDFGTGYSSLSYLNRFPIDKLKIDQSFVRDIAYGSSGASIVATIVAMAHHLGLQVIAEGVETQEQIDFLRDKKCDLVQGYYYSRPLPPDEFERFLKNMDRSAETA
ncbi:PAS domain S-box-containing protein/diguanylate cyclase (GGDEF) domain-containing protein [Paenibacillus tianmuensis]|uniref:PAS domain S-box-containing protein/diguanylate cyclase (GGDEF) domain-containing protein n=1 Tax=Paenibacillus tianmuensis TaxID=624147 RepID=A0A1G4PQH8_9BACL|nr:EAL domain-containing protein [Paenibacillus tianmuensis]SCW34455.1 PAS domain S-box-containing protein/diguanylate cyclase (GGDEF) domain-containing protein [Paenibacillus tianmuensis]